jgi:hypothetical protein
VSQSSSTPEARKSILPPPVEIAKIAAALRRSAALPTKEAIDEAIALYLETGLSIVQVAMETEDLALLDLLSEVAAACQTWTFASS